MELSAGIIRGSDPEQLVLTEYDPIAGRVCRKLYYTVDEFRAAHAKSPHDLVEAAMVEARQNILS